jgi:hypothetical protein
VIGTTALLHAITAGNLSNINNYVVWPFEDLAFSCPSCSECLGLDVFMLKVKQSHYRPEQAQRVGRGFALLFRDLGARSWWSASRPGRFTPGKDTVHIVQEAGDVCDKSRPPTGIRSSDLPTRSQSLYRLSYPAYRLHVQQGN